MESVTVGDIVARYVRSRGKRGPQDGRIYWRAELHRRPVWAGWGTPEEVTRALSELVLAGVQTARPKIADIRTVRDLLEFWVGSVIDEDTKIAESTRYAIRGQREPALRKDPKKKLGGATGRLVRDLGDTRLDRLNLEVLKGWERDRRKRGKGGAPNTLAFELVYLSQAWAWGRQIGATPDQPLHVPEIERKGVRDKFTPSTAEVAAVARWLRDNAPAWAMAILLLQAATGARIGEVAGVRWCDIDSERRSVVVTGKTGTRTVHDVRPDVLARIALLPRGNQPGAKHKRRDPGDHVVWGVSRHTADQVGRYVDRACKALGLRRWTSHGIRRMCVDTAIRNGTEIAAAADMFGHSPVVMWTMYRQVNDDDRQLAAKTARLGVQVDDGTVIPMRREDR